MQILREGLNSMASLAQRHNSGVLPKLCQIFKENIRTTQGTCNARDTEALEALSAQERVTLGLLTGNIEEGPG